MSGPSAGIPGHTPSTASLLKQRWQTGNPAHAIQRAAAVLTFPEALPSFVIGRTIDAVRPIAFSYALLKEEPVSSVLFQIGPGGAQQTAATSQEGSSFQQMLGAQITQSFNVTKDAIRFETATYTRWIAFRTQLASFLEAALPVLSQSTPIGSIGLEYVDFFYAAASGAEDVGLILDNQSQLMARRAFRKRDPFHAHSGWFDTKPTGGRNLINVDVTVADSNGPVGLRRTITVRTYEAEQISDLNGRGLALTEAQVALQSLDALHVSLKERLSHILTRDAKNMISLGS